MDGFQQAAALNTACRGGGRTPSKEDPSAWREICEKMRFFSIKTFAEASRVNDFSDVFVFPKNLNPGDPGLRRHETCSAPRNYFVHNHCQGGNETKEWTNDIIWEWENSSTKGGAKGPSGKGTSVFWRDTARRQVNNVLPGEGSHAGLQRPWQLSSWGVVMHSNAGRGEGGKGLRTVKNERDKKKRNKGRNKIML